MGTIYIVKNPHYVENYYKVGKTSRTAEDRLSDTKNASAFSLESGSVVIAEYAVYNLNKVESLIHQALFEYKVDSDKKEWFKIELSELKKIIKEIVNENNSIETEEPPNEKNTLKEGEKNFNETENSNNLKSNNEKRKRGGIFNFLKIVGILFWSIGILSAIGGGGIAAVFVIVVGVVIHLSFR